MRYPEVLGEIETLNLILSGRYRSFVRYGDGCFNLMRCQRDVYHDWSPELAYELAEGLASPAPGTLLCLPRPVREEDTLYYHRWKAFLETVAGVAPLLKDQVYGSSYISRMDSAPECHTRDYWLTLSRLWVGKHVTLVAGSHRSLTRVKLLSSPNPPASVTEIEAPFRNAYNSIEHLEHEALHADNEIVLLCTGTAARPLVPRLTRRGLCAYDLGHVGLYFDSGNPRPLQDCR